jgi:hypothetical protein
MGTTEEVGKVATATVESLKSSPLALALIIINVLFLIGGGYILHDVGENLRGQQLRKDELLAQLAKDCIVTMPKKEAGK